MTQEQMKYQGQIIRKARERKNMTQEDLAKRVHVTKQAVSNWENGNNNVDEGTIPVLEKELGIRLSAETTENVGGFGMGPRLHPLDQIVSLEELDGEVQLLLDIVNVDKAYASTVSRMLRRLLSEVLGYETYYMKHIRKEYEEYPLTWETIASDLRDVVNCRENYPIPDNREVPPFFREGLLARKIEYMAYIIGQGLFEDFDESGHRNEYEQQVGRQGEEDGYELLDLVSDEDNSIMISFKAAVLAMVTKIQHIG